MCYKKHINFAVRGDTVKDRLFEKISELNEKYIGVWRDVCEIESPTGCKTGVDAVGEYFKALARERGWKTDVFSEEKSGDVVVITMNPDAEGTPVSLSGHMDTVHEIGAFGYPTVRIEGDKIYGPGVTDCKGGIVAGFLAMDALYECGFNSRPVVMYLQSDEECGSKYSGGRTIERICEAAQGSAVFINLECGDYDMLTLYRKGIADFYFTVKGVEAHSSLCAVSGANAIAEAAHKIIELEKFKDGKGLTVSCTVINGGSAHNIVPGECNFIANARFATNAQLEMIREYAQSLAGEVKVEGCSSEVVLPRVRPAMEMTEERQALLGRMNEIWQKNGLSALSAGGAIGGSDAANVSLTGVPTVDGLGVIGGNLHRVDEYGIISSLELQAKRIALIACYI